MDLKEVLNKLTKEHTLISIPEIYRVELLTEVLISSPGLILTSRRLDFSSFSEASQQPFIRFIEPSLDGLNGGLKEVCTLQYSSPIIIVDMDIKKTSWEQQKRQETRLTYFIYRLLTRTTLLFNLHTDSEAYECISRVFFFRELHMATKNTLLEIKFREGNVYLELRE